MLAKMKQAQTQNSRIADLELKIAEFEAISAHRESNEPNLKKQIKELQDQNKECIIQIDNFNSNLDQCQDLTLKLKQQKEDNEKKFANKLIEIKALRSNHQKQKEVIAKLTSKKEEYAAAIKTL